MSHSLTRVWVHSVLGTKNRQPLLKDKMRTYLYKHIRKEMEDMGCGVRIINGIPDHIHIQYHFHFHLAPNFCIFFRFSALKVPTIALAMLKT